MGVYHAFRFVQIGVSVKGATVAWYKNQETFEKTKSKSDAKDLKEFPLQGGNINMFPDQWMLDLPASSELKSGYKLQFEPVDGADLSIISAFCEALVDAGIKMGDMNKVRVGGAEKRVKCETRKPCSVPVQLALLSACPCRCC